MCLIEVAKGSCRIRQVLALGVLQMDDGLLEASDSSELLGADTDVVAEGACEMLTGPTDLPREGMAVASGAPRLGP